MKPVLPLLALAALAPSCGTPPPSPDAGPPAGPRVFATVNDELLTSGALASVDRASLAPSTDIGPPLQPGDSVLAWHAPDRLVLMETGSGVDNVTLLDVSHAQSVALAQVSARAQGESAAGNARGYVAIDDHRGYVARLSLPRLGIVDWSAGTLTASSVDLSAYDGGASLPWARSLAIVNGAVWVMLERLGADFAHPTTTGAIVRIDPRTDTALDASAIDLGWPDPVGRFAPSPDGATVFVACVGSYQDDTNGAVVAIDATTLAVRNVVTERDLGANVDAVVALDSDRLLLRVSPRIDGTTPQAWVALLEWSIAARTQHEWLRVPKWRLTEPIAGGDGRVYVGDRGDEAAGRPAGLRVFDASDGHEVTTAAIPLGALPYDLASTPGA